MPPYIINPLLGTLHLEVPGPAPHGEFALRIGFGVQLIVNNAHGVELFDHFYFLLFVVLEDMLMNPNIVRIYLRQRLILLLFRQFAIKLLNKLQLLLLNSRRRSHPILHLI